MHKSYCKVLFKKRITSTFLGLILLAATTLLALENNLSDGTDVPGTHKYITWAKYRVRLARNQVAIDTVGISIGIDSIDNCGIVLPISNKQLYSSHCFPNLGISD